MPLPKTVGTGLIPQFLIISVVWSYFGLLENYFGARMETAATCRFDFLPSAWQLAVAFITVSNCLRLFQAHHNLREQFFFNRLAVFTSSRRLVQNNRALHSLQALSGDLPVEIAI